MTAFEELICAIDKAGAVPDAEALASAMKEAGLIVMRNDGQQQMFAPLSNITEQFHW